MVIVNGGIDVAFVAQELNRFSAWKKGEGEDNTVEPLIRDPLR